jgi:hypothetical protein
MRLSVVSVGAAAIVAILLAGPVPADAQRTAKKAPSGKNWTPPKTSYGVPDLQGYWTNVTLTPLQRPPELGNKEFFTPEEAQAYEAKTVARNNADRRDGGAAADVSRAYNNFWWDRGTKVVPSLRTSLIVDPPDGRIPPLTPEAQKHRMEMFQERRMHSADGPEDRVLSERCILWPTAGPPMLPSFYNNNYQIVQGPGYVAILVEMIHDVRMIPTDGSPHLPKNVRLWMGDPRGHWEGNTLVVDTTNFTDKTNFQGADENLHLIERFTRVNPDTILYKFTVDDPTAFTRPWSAEIPMTTGQGPIIEYACNEGNYAMADILAGARAEEKKAAEPKSK